MDRLTEAQIEAAEARGREMLEREARAVAARYDAASGQMILDLTNGCTFAFPPRLAQGLEGATDAQIEEVEVLGVGFGLRWETLDVDLWVPGLLAGKFGTKAYMERRAGERRPEVTAMTRSSAEAEPEDLFSPAERAAAVAQARAFREQACRSGLRFETYLPPELADWVLEKVEAGVFVSPSEAVFIFMGESRDLESHPDLRRELLDRLSQAAEYDPGPRRSHEEVLAELRRWDSEPRPAPAIWTRSDEAD